MTSSRYLLGSKVSLAISHPLPGAKPPAEEPAWGAAPEEGDEACAETDEGWESYQTKELNNGRLAMFGSIGMLTGSYITGKGPLEVMNSADGGIVF